jgi:Spy/CpxP family protein refolding chaperone
MRDARPLDLPNMTDEQKEKIKQARLENMKAMTPLKNQAREKKAKLQTLLTTTPVDLKMADQVADELGKIGTEIMKRMIRHDQEIRNLLTPEQQVMYDARPKPFLQKVK